MVFHNSWRLFWLAAFAMLPILFIISCGDQNAADTTETDKAGAGDRIELGDRTRPTDTDAANTDTVTRTAGDIIRLPDGFRPEGLAIANGNLYVGSIPTGSIFRVDLSTGQGEVLVEATEGRSAAGLKVDASNRIFVAGGSTGQAFVYDARTGQALASYQLAEGDTFINDVTLTGDAAWFTDSRSELLYRIPLGPEGSPLIGIEITPLRLRGAFELVAGQTNANGIAASADGTTLIVVQTATGKLWNVEAETGFTNEIDLGGEDLSNGDGLLIQGRTLFVVRNRSNEIVVLELSESMRSATLIERISDPGFDVPTTVAASDGSLYVVNARFGIEDPDAASYSVVRLNKP